MLPLENFRAKRQYKTNQTKLEIDLDISDNMHSAVLMHNRQLVHSKRPYHILNIFYLGKYPLCCIFEYQDLSEIIHFSNTSLLPDRVFNNQF